MINVNYIKFVQQAAEIWPKDQISTFKKVPRGLVGLEVRVPPYSRVLCSSLHWLLSLYKTRGKNEREMCVVVPPNEAKLLRFGKSLPSLARERPQRK